MLLIEKGEGTGGRRIMRKRVKILSLMLSAACGAICMCGCEKEESQFSITMMAEKFPSFENVDQTTWIQSLENYTEVDLQFQMVPTLEYVSQVEQMIRNDKLPMVVAANENVLDQESFYAYLNAGGFWDLEDYLDDYPDLKNFVGADTWENSRIQGHIYGIPRLRILPRYTAYYRKDWAEKLGISPPETLEEIYEMLKAFTYQDPDGNGQDDTVGLADSWQTWRAREWNGIQTVTTALGGPNGWGYDAEQEKVVPDFATEEYMQMLDWFGRLYDEKIMDHSFSYLTPVQRQELFIQGYAGMIFGVIDDAPEMEDRLREMIPDAEVAILPVIRAEKETEEYRVNATPGYNGLILFNRLGNGAIKDEQELRRVLSFYNSLCSQEGQELLLFGTEGEFFVTENDGEKKLIYEEGNNRSTLAAAVGSYSQLMPVPAYVRTTGDSALQNEIYDSIESRENWLVDDVSYGLYSETYVALGDMLNQKIQKASIRYIMGEISEKGFRQEYEDWYAEGGKEIIEEYTKAYNE